MLINALSNVVKDNRDGGHIAVRCAATADGTTRIEIEDSEVGIRAGDLPLLCQPFGRLYLEAPAIEGSGIGLALSRQLVEATGGRISAEGRIGEGSTFAIELPLASQIAASESGGVGPTSPVAVPCALRTDL